MSKGSKGKRKSPAGAGFSDHSAPHPPQLPLEPSVSGRTARERPTWFESAIATVLDRAPVVLDATGPRDLDQLTSDLVGQALTEALRHATSGLWFDWWFTELVDAAETQVRNGAEHGGWQAPLRLLHGLTTIGSPALGQAAIAATKRLQRVVGKDAAPWLKQLRQLTADGDVVRLRDAYGTRFAVIAGFSFGGHDRSVFLFDIETSFIVSPATAGVCDDVEQAAAMWRDRVGVSARDAVPQPVGTSDELLCLAHLTLEEPMLPEQPEPSVLGNWFRIERRRIALADALRRGDTPLPRATSLYVDLDVTAIVDQFSAWHGELHGARPNPEAVEAMAYEWVEGAIPETWYSVSPTRIGHQLALIGDWIPDDPITREVTALLPRWVGWLAERADLAGPLRDRVAAAVVAGPEHS